MTVKGGDYCERNGTTIDFRKETGNISSCSWRMARRVVLGACGKYFAHTGALERAILTVLILSIICKFML